MANRSAAMSESPDAIDKSIVYVYTMSVLAVASISHMSVFASAAEGGNIGSVQPRWVGCHPTIVSDA
jgi:hypothetical protein